MRKQLLFASVAVTLVACGDNQISSPKGNAPDGRSSTRGGEIAPISAANKHDAPAFEVTYVAGDVVTVDGSSVYWSASATCPLGTKVIGGGFENSLGASSNGDYTVQISRPDSANNAWTVSVNFANKGGEAFQGLRPYAVCIG